MKSCLVNLWLFLGGATTFISSMAGEVHPRLVLPPLIEVVQGVPMSQHIRSAILEEASRDLRVEMDCSLGVIDEVNGLWSVDADDSQVGEFLLKARLINPQNKMVHEAESVIRVIPNDAGKNSEITLLLVGDSLTQSTLYPNAVARLLSMPGNPRWRMLGLHRPGSATPGVAHEGYGGWTWERFNTRFNSKAPGSKEGSSPFLFQESEAGKIELDVGRYFNAYTDGQIPDLVVFFLGINDCFSVDPDDPVAIDKRMDEVLAQAEKLIAAFRKAAPDAIFGICLTPDANSRESAFDANYKGRYSRNGWRRIQYRLVERQLEQFGKREKEGIQVIATSLVVDPVSGYPVGNAVHPNRDGYEALATAVYAWIKGRLADAEAGLPYPFQPDLFMP